MTGPRTCVVIPLFDHGATVAAVARGAAGFVPLVIVVDDGSGDGGGEAAREAASGLPPGREIEVLRLPVHSGKGAAILAGFRRASEKGFTHAIVLDADGQHRPSDIPRFLETLDGRRAAIVVGARDLSGVRVPTSSRVGRWISNFWTLRTTGCDLADTQSGFRLYPVGEVLALPIRSRGYDFEVEVLVRGAWAGLEIQEVPIDVWYPEPDARISHFRGLADNAAISLAYTRLALRRLWPAGTTRPREPSAPQPGVREAWKRLLSSAKEGTRPSELALAVGAGVFVGATPLWGLHAVLSVYLAARLHLNSLAAFLGSQVSNPFFAPYLVFASVQTGHALLHGEWLALSLDAADPARFPEYLLDYLAGSLPVAIGLSLAVGVFVLGVASLAVRRGRPSRTGAVRRRPLFSVFVFAWAAVLVLVHAFCGILLLPWTLLFDRDRRATAALGAFLLRASLRILWPGRDTTPSARLLDPARPAVIVLNHRSMADIPLAVGLTGAPRLSAKPWVGRIPGLGISLWLAGHCPFDPADPGSVREVMDRMEALLRRGVSVAIFPEGTRGPGPGIGEFQRGAFRLAVRTGVDVLPVVLRGTGDLLPRGTVVFTNAPFEVEVLPRMAPGDDEESLRDRVRSEMVSALERPRSP